MKDDPKKDAKKSATKGARMSARKTAAHTRGRVGIKSAKADATTESLAAMAYSGTQFTCFTCTKVHTLTPEEPRAARRGSGGRL